MTYVGSKRRIAKELIAIIEKYTENRNIKTWFEPFVGGANMIAEVSTFYKRVGIDYNEYLIELFKALQTGWKPKEHYNREEYSFAKHNKDADKKTTGWIGIGCCFRSNWFAGYAGIYKRDNITRSYQKESFRNIIKQLPKIQDVIFDSGNYSKVEEHLTEPSIIYCDPPYKGCNTGYNRFKFNYDAFYDWCVMMQEKGHYVFISEYNMPEDRFKCIWQKEIHNSLSATASTKQKKATEKLFIPITA